MREETSTKPARIGCRSIGEDGLCVLESLGAMCLLVILGGVLLPMYLSAVHAARIDKAAQQIRIISTAIDAYQARMGGAILPTTLADVGLAGHRDPWGRGFMYLNIQTGTGSAMDVAVDTGVVSRLAGHPGLRATGDITIAATELPPEARARVEKIRRRSKAELPLNSDYDLFSLGPDGASRPSLACEPSLDDLVRARDGAWFGQSKKL